MGLIMDWIVAIHYNAYVTIRDFVVAQFAIVLGVMGWLWMAKMIYQDKERLNRPKRRFI